MPFDFKSISDKIEAHPVIASMAFGTAILGVTILIMKNKSSSSNASNGYYVDPTTGQLTDANGAPIGTNGGGFTLTSQMSDVNTMFQDLQDQIAQLQNNINNPNNPNPPSNNNNNNNNNPPSAIPQWLKDLQDKLSQIVSRGRNHPPATPPQTTSTQFTLQHAESFQQIANEQVGGQLQWLLNWNNQLKNQPGYAKPWWTLPAGTVVNIPHANAGNGPVQTNALLTSPSLAQILHQYNLPLA